MNDIRCSHCGANADHLRFNTDLLTWVCVMCARLDALPLWVAGVYQEFGVALDEAAEAADNLRKSLEQLPGFSDQGVSENIIDEINDLDFGGS